MKVVCVGRNYAQHVKELSNAIPETPLIFIKPQTAVVKNNRAFNYPGFSKDVHYEVELFFRIAKNGRDIPADQAMEYVNGIGIGIDFTARDVQQQSKEKGWPWETAKAFDHSAPISAIRPLDTFEDLTNIHFHLDKNGTTVQKGHSGDMIFSLPELVAYMSRYFTLNIGDLIFTGTPAGVGPVEVGDTLEAYVEDQLWLTCPVT